LLHPYSETLASEYEDGEEIVFYKNRESLHRLIAYYRVHELDRKDIALNGYMKTIKEHTYFHRCRTLMETIQDRLF
jgi:spore maturation protein CgeB